MRGWHRRVMPLGRGEVGVCRLGPTREEIRGAEVMHRPSSLSGLKSVAPGLGPELGGRPGDPGGGE